MAAHDIPSPEASINSDPDRDGLFRARQMLLQLGKYVADFRALCHRRGLRISPGSELMMLADGLEHLKHFRVLLFRQKIYLEIEMVSLIRLNIASVLTHEDEQREENRFQRDDGGQKLVRERVECEPALGSGVEPEPKGEPDRVKNDKPHLSRVRGNSIAYTGRRGSLRQRAVFQFGNCLNVAGGRRGRLHSSMLFREARTLSFPVVSFFCLSPSMRFFCQTFPHQ